MDQIVNRPTEIDAKYPNLKETLKLDIGSAINAIYKQELDSTHDTHVGWVIKAVSSTFNSWKLFLVNDAAAKYEIQLMPAIRRWSTIFKYAMDEMESIANVTIPEEVRAIDECKTYHLQNLTFIKLLKDFGGAEGLKEYIGTGIKAKQGTVDRDSGESTHDNVNGVGDALFDRINDIMLLNMDRISDIVHYPIAGYKHAEMRMEKEFMEDMKQLIATASNIRNALRTGSHEKSTGNSMTSKNVLKDISNLQPDDAFLLIQDLMKQEIERWSDAISYAMSRNNKKSIEELDAFIVETQELTRAVAKYRRNSN